MVGEDVDVWSRLVRQCAEQGDLLRVSAASVGAKGSLRSDSVGKRWIQRIAVGLPVGPEFVKNVGWSSIGIIWWPDNGTRVEIAARRG